MRYLKIPEPIPIYHPVTKEETGKLFAFAEFVRGLLQDKCFMKSYKTVSAAQRIDAMLDAKAGDVIALETYDYDLLKTAVEEPAGGYLGPALQLVPFMSVVIDAPEVDPRVNGEKSKVQDSAKTQDLSA